jgi:hypothetical protein
MRCEVADDLVVNALRKAIERDTEFRLVALGDAPQDGGLFPDRKGPAKKAIKACTDGEKPLLVVREEAGKGKTPNQFARITDKGITTLTGQTPLKEFPELIAAAAPLLRTRLIRSCLRSLGRRSGELDPWSHRRLAQACLNATKRQFDAIETRLQETVNEEQLLSDSINDFLKTTRTRIENQRQRLAGELDSLVKAVTALVSPTDAAPEGQPRHPQLPAWQRVPTTDSEIDFQRNLSEELVFAWQDTAIPEIKAGLERALFNVGVERLGAPGDIVEFDGNTHHTDDEVADGEAVKVVLPGWQLVSPRGTSLLARAKVERPNRPSAPTGVTGSATAASSGEELPVTHVAVHRAGEPLDLLRAKESASPPESSSGGE